ncbi:glycosyltransferase family 2 protein [Sulfitobacter sp. S0837]|uniref:glycosyltransferase family 2 protein n=1 Tax=Sulfitobacter maritimus TaxID=2741719 RepID=UPI00158374B8|nr:glycosyltransferase family 2 protein [Sulfitobacter maritimus]NUH66085.1 glycosyltransferase family 2 protein [Sulfitobacter maritimus]
MKSPLHLFRRARQRLHDARRRARFAKSLQHLHGPQKLDVAPGDVVLIALVRDGAYYLDRFFAYYRAMGVRHFVFIDNGSSDGTIARIMEEPGTVIDQSLLPLSEYEDLIRQYPAQKYGQNRWCLYVDMDEIFDFEGRKDIGIHGLARYLQTQGYTALVAQMLEMFPKASLAETAKLTYPQALRDFLYFDISAVRRLDYHSPDIPFSALLANNELSNDAVKFAFGGVRGKVFGEDCCLTKHPLIFNGPGVMPAPHPHLSCGVKVADFTAVIKHYKFANDPTARDAQSLATGDLAHGEDAKRLAVVGQTPDLSLFSLDARRWNRVELLYRAGFLVPSETYSAHVAALRTEGAA